MWGVFKQSFQWRLLPFFVADSITFAYLLLFPLLVAVLVQADPAFQFADNNTLATVTADTLPADLAGAMVFMLFKVLVLLIVFVVLLLVLHVFSHAYCWNTYLKKKQWSHNWLQYLKMLGAWLIVACIPFVLLMFIYAFVGSLFLQLIGGQVVQIIFAAIGSYLLLWFLHATLVMQQEVFTHGKSIVVTFRKVVARSIKKFHKVSILWLAIFVVVGILMSAPAMFMYVPERMQQFITVIGSALYLWWARGAIAQ